MRTFLIIGCTLILSGVSMCLADKPSETTPAVNSAGPSVHAILRDASELALKQDAQQSSYLSDLTFLDIGRVQIRAGDYDGALRSIRGCNDSLGRDAGLADAAKALARAGNRDQAIALLALLAPDHGCQPQTLRDEIQLQWVGYLIASSDMGAANRAVAELAHREYLAKGLRQLAVAYSKSGNNVGASGYFAKAIEVATRLTSEHERATAIQETAEAQLDCGSLANAKQTINRLVDATVTFREPCAKVLALTQAAVIAAKAQDNELARHLFTAAANCWQAMDKSNRENELVHIAEDQARCGFIDDSLSMVSTIKHNPIHQFMQDSELDEALCVIAVAQTDAARPEADVSRTLAEIDFTTYRDKALKEIVEHLILKRSLKAALATTERFDNTSEKAAAMLKVAIAYARSGDLRAAADIAERIKLTQTARLPTFGKRSYFNYRVPQSWGVCYGASAAFTTSSIMYITREAAEVAGAAMELSLLLDQKPTQSYAVLFNDITIGEITRSLARTHAAVGDAGEALAWAKQIGGNGKVRSQDDYQTLWPVERRINALIGVAEGMLDRKQHAVQ